MVELSHTLRDGMVTVPGLPAPRIAPHETHAQSRERYAPGTEFHFASISMVGNTGTYVDAPLHRYEDGTDLAGVPLESLADLEGLVVRAEGLAVITRELLLPLDVRGRAVLVHTGWSRHWGTERYLSGHPHLTEGAAEFLVEQGAAALGIDSQNVDGTAGGERPVHTRLLAAGIPVVEHMTGLEALPPRGFRFHAAPPRITGVGTFPVRAYAIVTEE
nr:cyclase family protein [Actinocorallia populi]